MNNQLTENIIKEYKQKFPVKKFIPGESWVPVSGKVFDEQEMLLMTEAVLDGWWTEGKMTLKFEEKLATYIGMRFCSSVGSGSSANLIAFMALTSKLLGNKRIKKGDEVITVAAGFPTTVNPIIQAGCVPVFVDVELETMSINVNDLKKALSKKTKAIMVAHTLGNPFNLSVVQKFCKQNKLWLIEDNCDALGSTYNNQKTGSFGDVSTLSFYPAHHITTAEGGAVFTNNVIINKAIRSFRDWGRDCWCSTGYDDTCKNRYKWKLGDMPEGYDHKYIYSHIGYNLKMTEMQAACGLAQLEKLDKFIEIRKKNYVILSKRLQKFNNFFDIARATKNSDPSWFGLLITLKDKCKFSREDFLEYLNSKKIATRLLFAGNLIKQPYFIDYNIKYRKIGSLKNTDKVMTSTFWIGVYPGITEEMIDWVENIFEEYFKSIK
jgi:CDP-6-deoxy-D-xylo-4-hexulose-3-dehydrase